MLQCHRNEQKELKPQLTRLTQPTFLNIDSHLCGFLSLSANELRVEETQSTQTRPWGPVQLPHTHKHTHTSVPLHFKHTLWLTEI